MVLICFGYFGLWSPQLLMSLALLLLHFLLAIHGFEETSYPLTIYCIPVTVSLFQIYKCWMVFHMATATGCCRVRAGAKFCEIYLAFFGYNCRWCKGDSDGGDPFEVMGIIEANLLDCFHKSFLCHVLFNFSVCLNFYIDCDINMIMYI